MHATQQPVCLPEFLTLSAGRAIGDQHATLSGRVRMHGPSTGKFEIEADWKEWVDDLDKPGPELVASHGQLGEIQLPENFINLFSLGPLSMRNSRPRENSSARAATATSSATRSSD